MKKSFLNKKNQYIYIYITVKLRDRNSYSYRTRSQELNIKYKTQGTRGQKDLLPGDIPN